MKVFSTTAALALTLGAAPALAENWTMTSVWPSSLELIEIDRKWVETVNTLVDDDVLTIEFFEGGSLVPAGEVFGAEIILTPGPEGVEVPAAPADEQALVSSRCTEGFLVPGHQAGH